MTHNEKYYVKKITKRDAKGSLKISDIFNIGKNLSKQSSSNEIKDIVTDIINDIVDNVVPTSTTSPTQSTHDPEVEVVPSKLKKLSESPSCSYTLSSTDVSVIDQRKFNPAKYESMYKWMYYSHSKGGYLCKFCELYVPSSLCEKPFVSKGVQIGTHPTRQLETHQESAGHKASVEKYSFQTSNTNVARQLRAQMLKGKEKNRSVVKKNFPMCGLFD